MSARFLAASLRLLGALVRDRRGATAVFLAVSLIPMVGAVGLAVDSSIGYLLRTRMGKSLDAAGLAAGRMALDADVEAIAEQYFNANFQAAAGSISGLTFGFAFDPVANTVTLTAEATTPTVFMRVFGHDTMTVSARTVIQRETTGMELALVMDNTGSLWPDSATNIDGTNFDYLQKAALNLVDVIYGDEDEIDNVWISLVPYVAAVNIGPSRTGWLDAADVATKPSTGSSDYTHFRPTATDGAWKGCVMARAYPWDSDDTPPATKPFTSFFYPKHSSDNNFTWTTINDNYTASNDARRGPNLGCGTPITPLTASRATIEAGINAMKPWRRGGTTGNLGLAWGWRTISPNWRGLWGDASLPLDYGTDFMEKVVVILTDGNNTFNGKGAPSDYTAYGRVNAPGPVGLAASSIGGGETILNGRMTSLCDTMKANKIKIYTIIFGTSASANTRQLYQDCATTPAMYYWAKNSSEIGGVFRAIGGQLANLRILE